MTPLAGTQAHCRGCAVTWPTPDGFDAHLDTSRRCPTAAASAPRTAANAPRPVSQHPRNAHDRLRAAS